MNAIAGIYGLKTTLTQIENMVDLMSHRGWSKQTISKKHFTGIELDTVKMKSGKRGKKEKVLFSVKIYNTQHLQKLLGKPENHYSQRDDLLYWIFKKPEEAPL